MTSDGSQRTPTATGLRVVRPLKQDDDAVVTPHNPIRPLAPFIVACYGLAREVIGDKDFEYEIWARRHWLAEQCQHPYDITSLRDNGRLVGRRFYFDCQAEAAAFKLAFSHNLYRTGD